MRDPLESPERLPSLDYIGKKKHRYTLARDIESLPNLNSPYVTRRSPTWEKSRTQPGE
jgi:hypothetical protein